MTVRVLAPASTANLGPGFDCAAAALDLWNELVVEPNGRGLEVDVEGEGAEELPRDTTHLAVRAFARITPPDGYRFRFVNRIPLERGLGASASAVALGLVAGAAVAGVDADAEELLARGASLEGHGDNLAAALFGGVCLTWQRDGDVAASRVAGELPLVPVLVIPETRTSTRQSRAALPFMVTHRDAAASAASAALLGAAIARGDAELLRNAFSDRLHEPYRVDSAPLLAGLRERLPAGAAGVTLSGSGPSVVVWARREQAGEVADALRGALPDARVLSLRIAADGARLA